MTGSVPLLRPQGLRCQAPTTPTVPRVHPPAPELSSFRVTPPTPSRTPVWMCCGLLGLRLSFCVGRVTSAFHCCCPGLRGHPGLFVCLAELGHLYSPSRSLPWPTLPGSSLSIQRITNLTVRGGLRVPWSTPPTQSRHAPDTWLSSSWVNATVVETL